MNTFVEGKNTFQDWFQEELDMKMLHQSRGWLSSFQKVDLLKQYVCDTPDHLKFRFIFLLCKYGAFFLLGKKNQSEASSGTSEFALNKIRRSMLAACLSSIYSEVQLIMKR